jgi:hypothetical protein
MARKDRVPNPPKPRVQAPQRRQTTGDHAAAERRRRNLALLGGGAAVLLVLVLGIIFVSGRGGSDERSVLEGAGCTLRSFPGLKGNHVQTLTPTTKPKWNSFPPTSGTHYVGTAIWDFYSEPVPVIQSLHNLEHGGIIIHYGKDVPKAQIDELRAFYLEDPNGILVAPLPSLKNKIALSAWTTPDTGSNTRSDGRGWLAVCPKFDEGAFSAFVEEHRYKGPERFNPDQLHPGT